jgi:myo-inositol-1(or 4)-monophosphatase
MLTQQEITESHALIIDVFKSFRAELMESYGRIKHSTKSDESPVTLLDVKIETTLKEKLLTHFPTFGFKGEETDEVVSTNGAVWLIDPIDSTSSFIHGLPYCSNMAGLIVNGEIIASVIYHFASDELFAALKGQGAYKNGERIFVRDTSLSDSYIFADAYSYKNIYQFYAPDGVKFFAPLGATGYFFTRLAQGNIQGVSYLRANIKQHDIAAGILLSLEAGAEAVSFTDGPFDHTCLRFMLGTKSICGLTKQHRDEIINA